MPRRLRWTITTRLVAVVLPLAVLPMILVGARAYLVGRDSLHQRIGQGLEGQAERMIDQVDRMLFERYQNLRSWSADPSLREVATGDAEGRIREFLQIEKRRSGLYVELLCLDRAGTIVAATRPQLIGQSAARLAWFSQATAADEVRAHQLSYSELFSGVSFLLTAPIHAPGPGGTSAPDEEAPAGEVIGLVAATLNWSEILYLVNTARIGEVADQSPAAYAVLIDERGLALTQPYFDERELMLEHNLKDKGLRAAALAVQRRNGFVAEQDLYGHPALIGFAASQGYRDFRGSGWSVLVFQRAAEAFAPIRTLRMQIMALGFIMTVILSFVTLLLASRIAKPVRLLTAVTKAIAAQGDLTQRAPVVSGDEIGELAASFNAMVEDLARSREELTRYSKALEKSNRELDDFTYIVSHDLKEPLRSLDAFSKFVYEDYKDRLDEQGRTYLERIRANAWRMQQLVEDLLAISRLSRKPNELQTVDARQIIDDVSQRFEYLFAERHVEFRVSPVLPTMICDRVRLTEVFANLVSNAVKYCEKPACRIEIGYEAESADHHFFVRDNGPGIPSEYFEKIFEIFQRLGKREDQEGTGIGLTIVKKVVEMHRGKVWVESMLGQGTTFHFTIPVDERVIRGAPKLGEILVAKGIITEGQLGQALDEQRGTGTQEASS
jgi:signal transduction histidine kinase